MNLKRTATLVVVGGALAAWLAAAATSDRRDVASLPVVPTRAADDVAARGAELAAEVARLHDHLRPGAVPRHARNLFAFASARSRPLPVVVPPPAALTESPRALAVAPQLKLVGVAEDAGPDGPVRTAIISGLGQLFLVKEGESVTGRYRVARISADVVELADGGQGTTLRLALK